MPSTKALASSRLFKGRSTKAYRWSTNLKLGLMLFAVIMAVTSLLYTNQLVSRPREREQFVVELWTMARGELAGATANVNPYVPEFQTMQQVLTERGGSLPAMELEKYQRALEWAQSMPPPDGEITLASEVLSRGGEGIPAIVVDSTEGQAQVAFWQNVSAPEDTAEARRVLLRRIGEGQYQLSAIPIEVQYGGTRLKQVVFYDESRLIRQLRVYPYAQFFFVGLFVAAGYLGFSYIRRSEQSSLWAGMAKEAAHQLGTPISSLMGWHELLSLGNLPPDQMHLALDEIEKDIKRLRRVASRFSDIGSLPKLEVAPLAPLVQSTAEYMERRIPQRAKKVQLNVEVPPDLKAPLNPELFEWVVENLIKNALDAIETDQGNIEISAGQVDGRIRIDVKDTGKGIERSQWKNVFRPGYSTKKRGWGLGLSLAKRIVEDYHGGMLTLAQSRVGQGTTFRIELPSGPDQ